uniref:Uncharacterized protein n=1 Tax=Rhizophora mucronata TaxID=61149 RepID=A0A2P2NDN5_RHIMU
MNNTSNQVRLFQISDLSETTSLTKLPFHNPMDIFLRYKLKENAVMSLHVYQMS